MASTVIIWNNNMVSYRVGMGHKTVGHACMNISNQWVVEDGDNTVDWVSWWPGENSTGKRKGTAYKQFEADLQKEKYAPDHILRLRGLNEAQMQKEWRAIRTKENAHYLLNVKNCSTIVARVLRAGSSWTDRNVFRAHSALWTPLQAKRFAINLGGAEVNWTDFLRELLAQGAISQHTYDLWAAIKKRSDRHGNPDTPARFVGGVDVAKQEREAEIVRNMADHFRRGKHVDRNDKETLQPFNCKLCNDKRDFWIKAKELALKPAA
jgi:hypothetical protein